MAHSLLVHGFAFREGLQPTSWWTKADIWGLFELRFSDMFCILVDEIGQRIYVSIGKSLEVPLHAKRLEETSCQKGRGLIQVHAGVHAQLRRIGSRESIE